MGKKFVEMKYFIFRLAKKQYALELDGSFQFEPTQINKINKTESEEEECAGELNYKNEVIEVFDIARVFSNTPLKKFDGLLFIKTENRKFAIKFNGFYRIEDDSMNSKVLTIYDIIEAASLKDCFDFD